jgi:hypothetical protein
MGVRVHGRPGAIGLRDTSPIWRYVLCTRLMDRTLIPGEFVDLQVMEALEGHRESHFLELVRDVTTNHGWEGRHSGFFVE